MNEVLVAFVLLQINTCEHVLKFLLTYDSRGEICEGVGRRSAKNCLVDEVCVGDRKIWLFNQLTRIRHAKSLPKTRLSFIAMRTRWRLSVQLYVMHVSSAMPSIGDASVQLCRLSLDDRPWF